MTQSKINIQRIYLLATLFVFPTISRGVSPMEYFNSLVAGGNLSGFQDGDFTKARFNNPTRLVFDDTGDRLFVADFNNNRIRVVYLNDNNRVGTLAGSGSAGKTDGPFLTATFWGPFALAWIPPDRLAVYDQGDQSLRLVDLNKQVVTTLVASSGNGTQPQPIPSLWDLVYRPQDDCLYFSVPAWGGSGSLQKLDLKSKKLSTVISTNPLLPNPQALCVTNSQMFLADQKLPTIYSVEFGSNTASSASVSLKPFGQGDQILELSFSDGILYGLQTGKNPFIRVGPIKSTPVSLATTWGFFVDNQNPGVEPFMTTQTGQVFGFVASPTEPRKFFVTKPSVNPNSIISFKDYNFDHLWKSYDNSDPGPDVMDFNYPAQKPKNTYRILLSGDSRTFVAPRLVPGPPYKDVDLYGGGFSGTLRMDTMGKKLELFLNTEAALRGVKTHYEVLEWNRKGYALSTYAPTELPPLVKKYNVDMVLGLVGLTGYLDYFMYPLTSEGIPAMYVDPEYILKPLSKRVPAGAAADLYARYKKKVKTDTEKFSYPGEDNYWGFICGADPESRKDLIEMAGRRLQMLTEKIKDKGSPNGNSPKLVLFFIPFRAWPDCAVDFWVDLCNQYSFPFLDLSESFNATKISYYPTATLCCDGHYTAYGNELIGNLLTHYLIENSLIPFDLPKKENRTP